MGRQVYKTTMGPMMSNLATEGAILPAQISPPAPGYNVHTVLPIMMTDNKTQQVAPMMWILWVKFEDEPGKAAELPS